jgi:hypothetical protein
MANPSDAGVVWLSENEVLNRQVHSGQMKGTEPNYLAFRPLNLTPTRCRQRGNG